jgi:RNA polymerase sigma factor (sigma-70 family)
MVLRVAPRPLRLVPAGGEPEPTRAHDELAEVARRAGLGEAKAIQTLLAAVLPFQLRVVRRVLGAQHPEVEDVTQDSASGLLEALPRFRGQSSVLHFACRVAVLSAMSVRRKRATLKRALLTDSELSLDELASASHLPDRELEQRRSAEGVRELLDTLPLAQAEVLALHCVLGYTVAEIADAAGIPLETVRSRLRLAKQRAKERAASDPRLSAFSEEP